MTESGFKVEEKGRGWGEREVGGEDERGVGWGAQEAQARFEGEGDGGRGGGGVRESEGRT